MKENESPKGRQTLEPIGYIRTDLPQKFGVPRQSGVAPALKGVIVFAPAYRNPDALRGLAGFSHVWLIWQFSDCAEEETVVSQLLVRPPRLGGNSKVGVFASRSPFRPNHLGLSAVKIEGIILSSEEDTPWDGPESPRTYPYLRVSGVDMKDGTPLYDIKPYVPYADCIADAGKGFTEAAWKNGEDKLAEVEIPAGIAGGFSAEKLETLKELLAADPRPSYQTDPERIYGLAFSGYNIKFYVKENRAVVTGIEKIGVKENSKD